MKKAQLQKAQEKFFQFQVAKIPFANVNAKYVKQQKLGQGAYGTVYLGYPVDNPNKKVAIKEIKVVAEELEKKNLVQATSELKQIVVEVDTLKDLAKNGCHANILCYNDFFLDLTTEYLYLVTDYIKGLTLTNFIPTLLDRYQNNDFSYSLIFDLVLDLVDALDYVHSNGIIHGDIKPDNIMVKQEQDFYQPILIDFGLSCLVNNTICSQRGSPLYMAPEAYTTGLINKKSDIWSLGMSFYDLVIGDPFTGIHSEKKIKQILSNPNLTFTFNTPNADLNELLNAMLIYDYNLRPSAKELLERFSLNTL